MAPADATPSAGLVLGTAGHIDHGKTALIRALTGVDTDRLPEEKERGITIALGFAPLDLAGQRVSVVDVPGHERLIRTMVSGAAGIDLVLLVVAADEGVMPQTREHVAICHLLGIERGVVALTKRDLVDEEMCELASEEVRDLLADTALAQAPLVAVSSTTGEGVDALRDALARCIGEASPHTARAGPPRLAIDRIFPVRGFGTVVTGTLVGAPLSLGDTVEVHPTGKTARVRGLQSHETEVETAAPGARCAVNLQGLEVAELERGHVLSRPGALLPTQTLDVRLQWLDTAPASEGTVSVELLSGTTSRRARLAPIGTAGFAPASLAFARVHVDGDPIVSLPGDRFIVRGFSRTQGTGGTLGGGIVLDVAPPHRRRSDPALVRELETLESGDSAANVRERVLRAGLAGRTEAGLSRETGIAADDLRTLLGALAETHVLFDTGSGRWVGSASTARLEARLTAALDAFHAAEPLRPGMQRAALLGRLPENVPADAATLVLARLEAQGAAETAGDVVRRPGFAPQLDAETESLVTRIRDEAARAGLEPPNPRDWAEALGISLDRFRDLVAHLEREGALLRAPGDLWFERAAVHELRERVVAHLEQHGELDTRTYKGLIATTRRTAMPLMELLDELHVTRRKGDVRILRSGGGANA